MKSHLYNSTWSSSVPKIMQRECRRCQNPVLRPVYSSESQEWSSWSRFQYFSASHRSSRDWSRSCGWSKYVFLGFFFYLCEVLHCESRQTVGLRESSNTVWIRSSFFLCQLLTVAAQNLFMLIIVTSSTFLPCVCSLRHQTFYAKTRT